MADRLHCPVCLKPMTRHCISDGCVWLVCRADKLTVDPRRDTWIRESAK